MKISFYVFAGLVVLLSSLRVENSNDGIDKADNDVIGQYKVDGFNSQIGLELKLNGEFVYENQLWGCIGFDEVRRIRGNYKVTGKKLKLQPKELIDVLSWNFNDDGFEKDSVKYYSSDSTYLKKDFEIFKWDDNVYLLSEEYFSNHGFKEDENDFECFANYYNSGYEPKSSGSYFVKRQKGYEVESDFPISSLPIMYQRMFLNNPISAVVIEVKASEEFADDTFGNRNVYKIDKGKKDGVFKNMDFYGAGGCCIVRIMEVQDSISFGKIHLCFDYQVECKEGGILTTRLSN